MDRCACSRNPGALFGALRLSFLCSLSVRLWECCRVSVSGFVTDSKLDPFNMQFSLTLPQAAKRETELGGYFDRISALCAAATDMCSGGGCELWPSGEDALAGAWRSKQTDSHVRVFWYLPSKFKSRDVAFSCSDLRLSVGLKGHEVCRVERLRRLMLLA